MQHGKNGTYTKRACRCDECRAAHATYMRGYYKTPSGREAIAKAARKYSVKNPERRTAWNLVFRAKATGVLVQPDSCERCGLETSILDASHHDYSKPLDVEFICRPCHMKKDLPQLDRA